MEFKLSSAAFADGADIPARHTCDGEDLSPRLTWKGTPPGTRSLALVMDDPDAPRGTFTHWVVYDLPSDLTELGEGSTQGIQGRNSFGRSGYGGPCPPSGDRPHRYRFTLHALDVPTIALEHGTREQLEAKIDTHVLGTALLVGRYQRQPVRTH
ncbi:MAG: YbhB/YbcL family Raf kinase inhibitor-like protein [Acidobacteria bacterium]|nr:MAG: YbhB/YbcL family Raf kinase inhibitor-like protein [Acidobacteriota bacterium]